MLTLSEVVRVTKATETKPGVWLGHCPAHTDKHPSLEIKRGAKQAVIYTCRSQHCHKNTITAALKAAIGPGTPDSPEELKGKPATPVKSWNAWRPPWSGHKPLTRDTYKVIAKARADRGAGYMPTFDTLLRYDFRQAKGGALVGFPNYAFGELLSVRYFTPHKLDEDGKWGFYWDGPYCGGRASNLWGLDRYLDLPPTAEDLAGPDSVKGQAAWDKDAWREELAETEEKTGPLANSLFIVEGQWDCMALAELGFKSVSIHNTGQRTVHSRVRDTIDDTFDHIFLMLDNDTAGRECRDVLIKSLPPRTQRIDYPGQGEDFCAFRARMGDERTKELLLSLADPTGKIAAYNARHDSITENVRREKQKKIADRTGPIKTTMGKTFVIDANVAATREAPAVPPPPKVLGWRLNIVDGDTIQPEVKKWLWKWRLPLGRLIIFTGMGAVGKSTMCTLIATICTLGSDWPAGGEKNTTGPCEVLWLAAEESLSEDVKPRFLATGADMKKLKFVDGVVRYVPDKAKPQKRMFALKEDFESVKTELQARPNIKLIVFDPLTAYLQGMKLKDMLEVRKVLDDLKEWAEERGITIIALMNFNKDKKQDAVHRVPYSTAFSDASRAVFSFLRDPETPDENPEYIMANIKGNLVPPVHKADLRYKTVGISVPGFPDEIPTIAWVESKPTTGLNHSHAPKKNAAKQFTLDYIANGPRLSIDWHEDASKAGHNGETRGDARRELGPQIQFEKDPNTGKQWFGLKGCKWPWESDNLTSEDSSEGF